MATKSGRLPFGMLPSHGRRIRAGPCLEAQLYWEPEALVSLHKGLSTAASQHRGRLPGAGVPRGRSKSTRHFDALVSEVM